MIYKQDTLTNMINSYGEISDMIFHDEDVIILNASHSRLKFVNCTFSMYAKVFMENEQVTKEMLYNVIQDREYITTAKIQDIVLVWFKDRLDKIIQISFICDVDEFSERYVDMIGGKYYPYNIALLSPHQLPQQGELIGYKVTKTALITLRIPADAKRCNDGIYKQISKNRCERAFVIDIERASKTYGLKSDPKKMSQSVSGIYSNNKITYKVGKEVLPDSFNEDCRKECSHGIHFFLNKQNAMNYYDTMFVALLR